MEELHAKNELVIPSDPNARIYRKIYADQYQGQMVQNLWLDYSNRQSDGDRALDYPTQKPEALLERIPQSQQQSRRPGGGLLLRQRHDRCPWPKDSGANGSPPTSASSGSTPHANGSSQVQRELKSTASHSEPSRCSTSAATSARRISTWAAIYRPEEGAGARPQGTGVPRLDPARLPCPNRCRITAFFHGKSGGRLVVVGPINLAGRAVVRGGSHTNAASAGHRAVTCWRSSSRWACSLPCWTRPNTKGIDLAPKTIPPEGSIKRAWIRARCVSMTWQKPYPPTATRTGTKYLA